MPWKVYRFELPDRLLPQGGWEVKTQMTRILKGSPVEGNTSADETRVIPKGLLVRGSGNTARLTVSTPCGPVFRIAGRHGVRRNSKGAATARRNPPHSARDRLSGTTLRQHDFPSIAADSGAVWATRSSFHDRQEELNFRRYKNGQWTRLIPVGRASADLWRPNATTDDAGKPWLIWSQQVQNNWDIYAQPWEDNEWGPRERLSDNALTDIEPHVARGPDGAIYVVWQALEGRYSRVRLRSRKNGKWPQPVAVTAGQFDELGAGVGCGRRRPSVDCLGSLHHQLRCLRAILFSGRRDLARVEGRGNAAL